MVESDSQRMMERKTNVSVWVNMLGIVTWVTTDEIAAQPRNELGVLAPVYPLLRRTAQQVRRWDIANQIEIEGCKLHSESQDAHEIAIDLACVTVERRTWYRDSPMTSMENHHVAKSSAFRREMPEESKGKWPWATKQHRKSHQLDNLLPEFLWALWRDA